MLHVPKLTLRLSSGPALAALLLLSTLSASPAAADASCDRSGCGVAACATPAIPAPSNLWGELQPADASFPLCTPVGPAFCRDSTAFNEFQNTYSSYPWFMSVDTENGYAFLGLAYGMQIYDARSTPQSPTPVGRLLYSDIPVPANSAETKWPIQSVDAPSGIDTIAALAGESGIGLVAVDTTDKTKPKVLFQSYLLDGEQVYAATLGGRQYAFLAASSGNPAGGVFVYDLTRARSFDKCSEHYPSQDPSVVPQCSGVFVGKVGARTSAQYVHGVGNFVVLSSGTGRGFEIWNVSDPTHLPPQPALTGLTTQSVYGVAMWQQAGRLYLALRTDHFDAAMSRQVNQAQIYDVTCVTGSCAGLGAPLSSLELDSGTSNYYVTYSTSNGVPYIYYGEDDKCRGGAQREWLFDVSNPVSPRDVTPGTGYWGWYYRGNPTGFNNLMPRSGKFIGDYFYRAALSVFDIHKHNPSATPTPFIFIGGPTVGQTNQALTFTASTGICTPTPGGWNWNTSGGFISGGATGNSITVTWTTTGDKVVTATNVGCASAVGTHTVTLGDSSFLAANFSFSPGSPAAGQVVNFDASSTSGNPASYTWDFGDGTSGSGQFVNHVYGINGSYIVRLSVARPGTGPGCNSANVCTSDTSRAVIVGNGGPPIPQADFTANVTCVNLFGFEQCTASAGQTVTLTASPTSTSSYDWNFGDGTTGSGQIVTHTWAIPGTYAVQLAVSNARGTSSKVETFVIVGGPVGKCVQSATRLCLVDNRFAVDVAWRTPQGTSGSGQAVQLTRDTGYFWFFNSANVEMVLKVLDACNGFNHFWVFAGGLTNVRVDITVTDTVAGTVKTYSNPQNTPFQPIQDTSAFATCSAKSAHQAAPISPKFGTPSGTTLLLGPAGRFKVETTWRTPQGTSGTGQAVQLTTDTGYFYFFDSNNVEMVVKVLDACSLNQRFWDFAGGLTNVQVDIKVTDTKTGTIKMYHNPQNTPFQPIQDTSAFATCP